VAFATSAKTPAFRVSESTVNIARVPFGCPFPIGCFTGCREGSAKNFDVPQNQNIIPTALPVASWSSRTSCPRPQREHFSSMSCSRRASSWFILMPE
jgi:hypothetical protein